MTLLNRISQALITSARNAGRTRARRDLLSRSERFLLDNGFSRALLEQGNAAWPWRTDGIVSKSAPAITRPPVGRRSPALAVTSSERSADQAVVELDSVNDRKAA